MTSIPIPPRSGLRPGGTGLNNQTKENFPIDKESRDINKMLTVPESVSYVEIKDEGRNEVLYPNHADDPDPLQEGVSKAK